MTNHPSFEHDPTMYVVVKGRPAERRGWDMENTREYLDASAPLGETMQSVRQCLGELGLTILGSDRHSFHVTATRETIAGVFGPVELPSGSLYFQWKDGAPHIPDVLQPEVEFVVLPEPVRRI